MLTGKGDARKMELGKQIKKYRSEMNLSQDELAEKVFVSRQTVSNWENNKNYPDIKSLLLMSEVFGVSLDILVKGDIETMKKVINETEVKKANHYGNIFSILFITALVLFIPLVKFLKIYGIIIWVIYYAVCLVFALKVNKVYKENDVSTYKEIMAFLDGKSVEGDEKQREIGKRPYQNILKALFGAIAAIAVLFIMNLFFKVF